MKLDTRLSSILHLVLHMAESDRPLTSETMAEMLGTNPVVVRRTMSGLRAARLVRSEKGHGGGWILERALNEITLADIHSALGHPALLAFGNRNDNPQCLVEQAVNARMAATMDDVRTLVLQRLAAITLADIRCDFEDKLKDHHNAHHHS